MDEQKDEVPSLEKIISESKSNFPLQDYEMEKGHDEFLKVLHKTMKHGRGWEDHIDNIDIPEDEKIFLHSIMEQMNTFYMGKNSKHRWRDKIEFKYGHFSGYNACIKDLSLSGWC